MSSLNFTRDFRRDFWLATAGLLPDYRGEPYCFTRFADGEATILRDEKFNAESDHWSWVPDRAPRFRGWLRDAITLDLPGWHLGITCRDCHADDHQYLMGLATVPPDRITFAELFCYGNFMPWQDLDLTGCWVVGPHASARFGERGLTFPQNAMQDFARDCGVHVLARTLWWMLHVPTGPIVLACGPAAKVLAADYWRATSGPGFRRQVVVDAGSAMAWKLLERLTRHYQRQRSALSKWVPRWS